MTMMDRELLLKGRLPEADVEIPGGGTVRVRGLSRREALEVKEHKGDHASLEQLIISMALVDPVLSPEDVAAWFESSPAGEIEPVTAAIQRLSGLEDGAAKAAYKSVRRGSRK